jgi:hypothetical protein
MKLTTKFLIAISGLGLFYSFIRLFSGQGGSGLGDFFDALSFTCLIVFIAALVIILFNVRHLRKHIDTFLFLLIGLPMTIIIVKNVAASIDYNRTPDLSPKYPRPVTSKVYFQDSSRIAIQIDSLVELKNKNTGGVKVAHAFIDTIIYSQTGKQIFISYIQKFEPNDLGNDLDPAYLHANERDSIYWHLEEGAPNAVTMSGSYHDTISLKRELRKFYFNQYSFSDADSSKENYIWKR